MPSIIDNALNTFGEKLETLLAENDASTDIKKSAKAIASATFTKLDLVSREEFDAQTAVLLKTREKLEALEKLVEQLQTP